MVGDTILYCFVMDQQSKEEEAERLRQASVMQGMQNQGWTSWLLMGGMRCALVGGDESEGEGEGVHCTPRAVKQLILHHGRHGHS
mmetsp:Transcript_128178/g.319795  ORF Transcript_128178/g.319795 Transcript_128178/m.319795 type:complete len:85 (-) Transcript_128178:185-439(-)